MRGLSGAEKLSFTQELRQSIFDQNDLVFETVTGCPPDIFLTIGDVLSDGKDYMAKRIPLERFKHDLTESESILREWSEDQEIYPTTDTSWKLLANAYRHVGLLRIMRFPDSFVIPSCDSKIQESVSAILDACAGIPSNSPLAKRLLLPLFIAGADSLSPHQNHYLLIRINQIKDQTSFRNPAVTELLQTVWEARAKQDKDDRRNLPWMEWASAP